MKAKQIKEFNKIVDKCAELAFNEGFKHTSGSNQELATRLAKLSDDIKNLKISKEGGN